MCDECQRSICPQGCPNAEDEKPVFECVECREDIYEGWDYYQIGDEKWCEDCIRGCKKEAQREGEIK